MSCESLKGAAESAKKAVIEALNNNMETNTLSELWRHYLGLRSIAENHKHEDKIVINYDENLYTNTPLDFGGDVTFGGGLPGGMSDDIISFNTQGYGAADTVSFDYGVGEDHISLGTATQSGVSAFPEDDD